MTAGGWFWQKYSNGDGPWFSGDRTAGPSNHDEHQVRVEWTADKKVTLTVDETAVFTEEDFSSLADVLGNKIAFKCTSYNGSKSDISLKDIHYSGQREILLVNYAVSGRVTDKKGTAIEGATVQAGEVSTVTDATGSYSLELRPGSYKLKVNKAGYERVEQPVRVSDGPVTLEDIQLAEVKAVEAEVLSTEAMDVYAAKHFPSVVKYQMKGGELEGRTFYGQTSALDTIRINGQDIKLGKEDVTASFEGNKAVYTLKVKSGDHIDAVLTAELVAEGNTLSFEITRVENKLDENELVEGRHVNAIQTIEIPHHSLISVNSKQENANLKAALMSANVTLSGDEYYEINGNTSLSRDYMYAFISNSEMSAGLWSNAENDGSAKAPGVGGGSRNTRVMATTETKEDYVSLGLASTPWYWHREDVDSHGRWHLVGETDTPKAKIVIAGNINGDEGVDWQDGAVAFRSIMNNPYKSEEVPELVAYRIAMNFGGQAQNPFLTTLDNVKRVALHTDGLGQSVLLKGYANEGHDSGHPDYADIGQRIGGEKDMNTLMTKGAEYGARFGIHVNADEMYPEAKAFNDELVKLDRNGNLQYGWNWIDQAVGIDSLYDMATGLRKQRFDDLEAKVGQNLDFVYVDVWGNGTGGKSDSWQTRKLSKEINDNGWRMATEWGAANEYDSTFQHWATDLTYGGYAMKGENSEVMRFLRNHQKDSWVGDYPSYGGAAMAPLLGGYDMRDFEGWQGRNDYDAYIRNLYTHNLTTKFIQHYQIVDWQDADQAFEATNPKGGKYSWKPEMWITLKRGEDTLLLERGSANPDEPAYRDRTMTLNGKVIATGAVSRGDNGEGGTEKYLLPWIWDAKTGKEVESNKEKLYHWNTQGGSSEWDLPQGWENLSSVKVYKLTDLGKIDEKTVAVQDGKITLEAEAQTPYVVCKGKEENMAIRWSEGMHIVDAGFNSGSLEAWKKEGEGEAAIVKSQYSNPMLKLSGKVAVTQDLTDLEAGKQYALLVGVDNRSNAKASMEVKAGDKVLDSNYTNRSIAKNYVKAYTHNTDSATAGGSSYFQHMYVFFTAPKDGKVSLTLSKAGEGNAYFDDIRVVENDARNITKNDKGEIVKFEQDFEKNVQGLYPFVVGGIEGVEDNRIHLSELHAPYTQAGWNVKKMDDVLDGKWSVKINGLTGRTALAYQTIPQNFRFEPGRTYNVSFDYQAGSDGIYAVVVGSGEYRGGLEAKELPKAMGKDADGHYSFTVTGDASGQTWFGIYSTDKAPDLQGTDGSAANFGGYKELVLDNLVIQRQEEEISKDKLKALVQEAEGSYSADDYSEKNWMGFQKGMALARVALDEDKTSQADIEEGYRALKAAMASLDFTRGILYDAWDDSRDISPKGMTATAGSEQAKSGNEGPAGNVLDEDENTIWHTVWAGTNIKNHWIDIATAKPTTVGGLRLLQRSGRNGIIVDAEVFVKTTTADYKKVADAHFGNAGWQAVTFDEVENVTNVKLVPKATTGDVANKFSAAAEIRLMGSDSGQADLLNKKADLKKAIDEAKALKKEDYTAESYQLLQTKLAAAEKAYADEEAGDYEILLTLANLRTALADLKEGKTPDKPLPLEGWHRIGENKRYYKQGKAVTGLKTIGQTTYLFDKEGNVQYKWQVIDGQALYFDPTKGGGMLTGLHRIGQTVYLFDSVKSENAGAKLTGWHRLNGHDYYFDPQNGGMWTGKRLVGKTYYLFNSLNARTLPGAKLDGWHRLSGHDYYFDPARGGGMVTGWQRIGKTDYLFDGMKGKNPGAELELRKGH